MILVLLLVGLFAISTTNACGQCETKHPQQHFCDADFAMKLRILDVSRDSDIEGTNVITAVILSSWKRGPAGGEFQFYGPNSFCGTNFVTDRTYVVTGTKEISLDNDKYWLHGSCDFGEDWNDMSSQQKRGFRKEYREMCRDCEILQTRNPSGVKVEDLENDYREAATYWTPTNCYYNPHKTQLYKQQSNDRVEDCEDQYGVCAMNLNGQCNWQMTAEYEECFKVRDDFVIARTGEFAITDIEQCQMLPKRKRKKCRKQFAQRIDDDVIIF